MAWGDSGWGQLGQGHYGGSSTPVQVPGLSGVTAIAAGDLHSLALKSGGTVWAWGYDGLGEMGNGMSDENAHSTPVKVSSLTGVVALGGGTYHVLALRSDDTVWAWGRNDLSQLGAATTLGCGEYQTACSTVPIRVSGTSGVTAVAGGSEFSLALNSDGTVWGWGDNGYGQLASGTTTSYGGVKKPTRAHLSSITAIAAGGNHILARQSSGMVWTAGENDAGQLGNGTLTDSSNPVRVVTLKGVAAIGAGLSHSLSFAPSS